MDHKFDAISEGTAARDVRPVKALLSVRRPLQASVSSQSSHSSLSPTATERQLMHTQYWLNF